MPNNMYESEPRPATPTPAPQEQNDSPAPLEQSFPDTSTGQLVVSVFTANQLYPVVGAQVTVTEENSETETDSGHDSVAWSRNGHCLDREGFYLNFFTFWYCLI